MGMYKEFMAMLLEKEMVIKDKLVVVVVLIAKLLEKEMVILDKLVVVVVYNQVNQ